jgi:DNA-binding NtrC family response regulator
MAQTAIAVLGDLTSGRAALEPLLAEFDWSAENTLTLDGLAEICSSQPVVAVLLDPEVLDLPWKQAIAAVQQVAPKALPILCHRVSDAIDWTEASAAGAFHLLGLPLDLSELRQSLGFVWAEKHKQSRVIPLSEDERSKLRGNAKKGAGGSSAAAHVA